MDLYTTHQRILVLQTYYENSRNITNTYRKLRSTFGRHGRPTEPEIRKMVKRFEETGSVDGCRPLQYSSPARTRENIDAVSESVREDPTISIRHRSQELEINATTLPRILIIYHERPTITKKRNVDEGAVKAHPVGHGVKVPSGRGIPAKNTGASAAIKNSRVEGSDEVVGESSEDVAPVVHSGRGRPRKVGKPKISHPIEATGKGRGRPKNPPVSDLSDDDDSNDDDVHIEFKQEAEVNTTKAVTKPAPKKGRPKKIVRNEEDLGSDVGRPATGAVNLNIGRTGGGQGRPKKTAVAKKRPANDGANGSSVPRKRGRPATGRAAPKPYAPTGKPRGRPRVNKSADSPADSRCYLNYLLKINT